MAVYFDQYYNTGIGDTPVKYGGKDYSFVDAYSKAFENQMMGSNSDSITNLMKEELDPLIALMNENYASGKVDTYDGSAYFENPGDYYYSILDESINKRRETLLRETFKHLRENPDLYPGYEDFDEQKLADRIRERAMEFIQSQEEVSTRTSGMGTIAEFLGSASGFVVDKNAAEIINPIIIAELFYGSGKQKLAQAVLKEAAVGSGVEAMLQSEIKDWYNSLGLEYTYEDFLKNVGTAGIIGGAFPVAGRLLRGGIRLTRDQIKRGVEAFKGRGIDPTDADMQIRFLEDLEDLTSADAPGGPLVPADQPSGRTIDLGVDEWQVLSNDELRTNPVIQRAEAKMNEIPVTVDQPGYGTVKYDLQRVFINPTDGSEIVGVNGAIKMLYDTSRTLAWTADNITIPVNPNKYEKRAIIVLGPPASGKSSISNPIARKYGAAIIDADEAKKMMPEFQDGVGANAVHEESKFLSDVVQVHAIDEGINVVIPTVGSKVDKIEQLINKFKNNGYQVDLVGMNVSAVNARNRMVQRFITTGRYIPMDYIESVGENPMLVYNKLKEKGVADGYTQIDNNVGARDAKPVIEDTRGVLEDVELRLRRGGPVGGGLHPNARRTVEDEAPLSNFEVLRERSNRAVKSQVNLEKGNLPDDDIGTTQRRPAPPETKIDEPDVDNFVDQVSRDTDFDNLADDEIINLDLVMDDEVVTRSVSGADIKKELAQDQQMLDRLRGCVV